ncbi:MAG: hypothetical protein K2P22_05965, partial [Lachnospiraceae bacterium]|nr:hypothetical protein [Lachnospiraceae bacterium]
VKAGTATITVTTADRGYTASCTVTVTAQGTVAVNVPVGRANVLVDGTKVETVAKGQTISLDPAAALTVTSGATNNGDGTYTITGDSITIEAKDATYTWNNFFSQWFHLENGQQVLVPAENRWTVASVAVTSLSRFGLARAAETEDDRKPIDTTDPNWFFDYITDPTKTFEIDVTITRADGTTTTVTFTGSVRNNALTIAPVEGTPEADANAAWSAMGTEGSNTGAFEPAEPVQSDIVTLDATAATTVGTTPNTTKVEDIQSNIKVAYDKETKTFKVTGDLTYQKGLVAYSNNNGKNVGYFVALDLGWAEADRGAYKVQISEIDNGVEKWKNDDLAANNAARTEVILGRVADGTGKMIGNRSIKVTNDFLGTQEIYTIDLSGLKCITPELLKITAVKKEDVYTGLAQTNDKKISDIQTGVKVSVDEAAKTVKLTGTLHPVTTAWTDWSNNGDENTGYYAAIYLDASSMTNTTMTIYNPNSVGAAGGKQLTLKDGKDTLIIRVASLSEKLTGAPEAGKNATIVVSNANSAEKMVTYTLDFSGLTLEPRGNGEAKLTAAYGEVGGSFGSVKGSDFQKNLTITKTGDTFYFTGELNPIKWTEFSNDQELTKGYYVFFNIDASDVTGAAAWSVRGNAGGNSPTAKEDFAFFLGNTELKNEDIKSNTLYVLSEAVSGSGVPDAGKTLKTYRLDFSGVTLLEAEPFTVTARSTGVEDANVHQELLCDMDSYKVTVDHKNKKIVVTGDLYAISEVYTPWAYGELKPVMGTKADSEGYFVTFQVNKSSLEDSFAFKTEGVDKKNNGKDTTDSSGVIVRVAKTGATENAAGRLLLKTGSNEYETYEFDLTGVTFKLSSDRTEPANPNAGGQA